MNKLQAILVAHAQVDLAAFGAEIGREQLEALSAEVSRSRVLARLAVLQVHRPRLSAAPRRQALNKAAKHEK